MERELNLNGDPVKVSVAIYEDKENGSKHVMLEAAQGGFCMRHFMAATDARVIGIALCDAANEIELGAPWEAAQPLDLSGNESNESNDNPDSYGMWQSVRTPDKVWSPHNFLGNPQRDCLICGQPCYARIHYSYGGQDA